MKVTGIMRLLAPVLAVSLTGSAHAAITTEPARVQRGFLTAPSNESAREIATAYLNQASAEFGLETE